MLSIVIPTLNEEKRIAHTLRSLKALHRPHEVIVSDGASTDETVVTARPLAHQVVEYTGAHRQTIAEGRNAGGHVAHGDVVLFLDADCEIHEPNHFYDTAMQLFAEDPKLLAIAPVLYVAPEHATYADRAIYWLLNTLFIFMNNVLGMGVAPGECQIVRTRKFHELGGYRSDLVASEDADFFWRLSRIGKTRMDKRLVVYHSGRRIHKVGWPTLLSEWAANYFSVVFRGKSVSKEWVPVR